MRPILEAKAMSGAVTWSGARVLPIGRARRTGRIAAISAACFFTIVTLHLAHNNYFPTHDPTLWTSGDPPAAGGRWLERSLIELLHLIPGAQPFVLSLLTIGAASFGIGQFAHDLVRRGWPPPRAALAAGLITVHPVMLSLATSGTATCLYVLMAAVLMIALDRFEAIGDTQSLILLGLLLALLAIGWPDAVFFIIPLTLLLPWAFKDIRSYSAATALYVIALTPAFIALSAVALGGSLFEVPFSDVFAIWAAPLHGAGANVIMESPWLETYGGHPLAALINLSALCLVLMPALLTIVLRFATAKRERANPVTGVAALTLPPVSGAIAAAYHQLAGPNLIVALALGCTAAWAGTTTLRRRETYLFAALLAAGALAGWATPWLWQTPSQTMWRAILWEH
jgi:hypothetical protein